MIALLGEEEVRDDAPCEPRGSHRSDVEAEVRFWPRSLPYEERRQSGDDPRGLGLSPHLGIIPLLRGGSEGIMGPGRIIPPQNLLRAADHI